MSAIVTCRVVEGSDSLKPGRYFVIGSSHPTSPRPTDRAMAVAPSGLDTEASWKTVFSSTRRSVPTFRTPKPFA